MEEPSSPVSQLEEIPPGGETPSARDTTVTPEEPGPSALPPDQTRKAVQNTGTPAEPKSLDLPELDAPTAESADIQRVSMLHDVNLRVKIELGRTWMLVEEVLRLGQGSVVELDKLAGDPVDVYVNDRLIARGEVLVLNDNFCVRISEVLSHDPHRVPV